MFNYNAGVEKHRTVDGVSVAYYIFEAHMVGLNLMKVFLNKGLKMFCTTNNKLYFSTKPVFSRNFDEKVVIPRVDMLCSDSFKKGSLVYVGTSGNADDFCVGRDNMIDLLNTLPYTYCVVLTDIGFTVCDYRINSESLLCDTYQTVGSIYQQMGFKYTGIFWKGFRIGAEYYTTNIDQWDKPVRPKKGVSFVEMNFRLFREKVSEGMGAIVAKQNFGFEDVWYDNSDTPGSYKESGYWYIGSRAGDRRKYSSEHYKIFKRKDILATVSSNPYKDKKIQDVMTLLEYKSLLSGLKCVGQSYYLVDFGRFKDKDFVIPLFKLLTGFGPHVFLHHDFESNNWFVAFNCFSFTDLWLEAGFDLKSGRLKGVREHYRRVN